MTTQTPTIMNPRRFSAPFCFVRILSMTCWRSVLAGLATDQLPGCLVGVEGRVYGLTGAEPDFGGVVCANRDPTVCKRDRDGRLSSSGLGPAAHRIAVSCGVRHAAQGRERRDQVVGGGRAAERRDVAGVAAERGEHGLPRSVAEHVGAVRPDDGGGSRAVVARRQHEVGTPADDGERAGAELALRELRRTRDLVGHRRGGHGQLVAVGVHPAGVLLEDLEAGCADRDVGLALAPRPAGGVGDHDRDVATGPLADAVPERACGRVGVRRQEHDAARLDVGVVDAGGRQGQSVAGADDARAATAGQHPQRLVGQGVLARAGADPALRLAHDLARHRHHVAVRELGHGEQQRDEVVARRTSGTPSGA